MGARVFEPAISVQLSMAYVESLLIQRWWDKAPLWTGAAPISEAENQTLWTKSLLWTVPDFQPLVDNACFGRAGFKPRVGQSARFGTKPPRSPGSGPWPWPG